jgi:cell division protein FtsL
MEVILLLLLIYIFLCALWLVTIFGLLTLPFALLICCIYTLSSFNTVWVLLDVRLLLSLLDTVVAVDDKRLGDVYLTTDISRVYITQ